MGSAYSQAQDVGAQVWIPLRQGSSRPSSPEGLGARKGVARWYLQSLTPYLVSVDTRNNRRHLHPTACCFSTCSTMFLAQRKLHVHWTLAAGCTLYTVTKRGSKRKDNNLWNQTWVWVLLILWAWEIYPNYLMPTPKEGECNLNLIGLRWEVNEINVSSNLSFSP